MKEKRRHARVRFPRRAWCDAPGGTQLARIEDASEEGLFVRTPRPARPGERVRLTLEGTAAPVVADARVVWAREAPLGEATVRPGMGLRIERFEQGAEVYRALLGEQRSLGSSPGWLRAPGVGAGSGGARGA